MGLGWAWVTLAWVFSQKNINNKNNNNNNDNNNKAVLTDTGKVLVSAHTLSSPPNKLGDLVGMRGFGWGI